MGVGMRGLLHGLAPGGVANVFAAIMANYIPTYLQQILE
jgi:citrate synthase